ncbi:efflux RND transporter periplasmic adaptor subunit [Metapseudomonas resinovorans]|uniref:Putative membrane fusion protein n=1 Tax=Metapseudomonas resinovorans NBRC 106553 TaxID=1245471 RepID=S6AF32_METRE|nr:efflux RND transporter periplasmic adaptor subunit [Pseudomonas resinovorans]BAN48457.1 putative membrane fusion protein [Pseudomonas resinovorans NBRC 106553]
MKRLALSASRLLVTLLAVAVAAVLIWQMVAYYLYAPWTRDGHIRVDVVQVAPDVSGLIAKVEVHDNQPVSKGQVLFLIDQERFKVALQQAQAVRDARRESLAQARREQARNRSLGKLVARELVEESDSAVLRASAALSEADATVDGAQLNLARTVITSPVDGYLNDRAPRVGEFVSAGHNVLAVVDKASFHLDGYFEETKLGQIHVGQGVDIRVMGDGRRLTGRVESIAAAIEDRDRTSGANLLPNVNPAFSWVRLAQRVPVRIQFDEVPDDFAMVAGRTATVSIIEAPVAP